MRLPSTSNPAGPAAHAPGRRARSILGLTVFAVSLLLVSQLALAGTGGGELDPIWTMLTDFVEGTLGRIITLLIIIVGIGAGIMTQSLGAFAVGLGAGIGLAFSPEIIEALFGATIVLSGAGV